MDVDEILCDIGEFGKFQKLMILFVMTPCICPAIFSYFGPLLMIISPPAPNCCQNDLYTNISNTSISMGNVTDCVNPYEIEAHSWSINNQQDNESTSAMNSLYRKGVYKHFNERLSEVVICQSELEITLFQMTMGLSEIFGSLLASLLENRIDRLNMYFLSLTIAVTFGIVSVFSTSYWMWVIIRFLVMLNSPVILYVPYTLVVEMVGPKYRTDMSICNSVLHSAAIILIGVCASYFRNWRLLSLFLSVSCLIIFLLWRFIPESPRWYLAHGKFNNAVKVLQKTAKINGRHLTDKHIINLKEYFQLQTHAIEKNTPQYTIKDLFVKKSLRKITVFVAISNLSYWSVNTGLFMYVHLLGGDRFMNFILCGLVRMLAYLIGWPFMKRFGRRSFLCSLMITSGVACVLTPIFDDKSNPAVFVLYFIGVMGSSLAGITLLLFTAELYPTPVRTTGLFFSSFMAAMGATLIPVVIYLDFESRLPLMLMGVISVIGGCFSFLLKETQGKHLEENVVENGKLEIK